MNDQENFLGYNTPETNSHPEQQQKQQLDPKRVKEDLLALGIDVDYHVIGRMQKLGLSNTWATTSKAASSLRKRNPYGVPSNVSYQNLDDPEETSHTDNQEQEKEWSRVDQQQIRLALKELENRDSALPSCSRINALKLLQIFKIQYNRSADKFVSSMLAQKNKKGLIRAGQLMKTRFVLHSSFSEMVLRLHKQAAPDVIAVLFTILAQDTEINGLLTKLIDIKAFLMMLKLANDDTRRSFDDKTSKVANEVEFWNQSRRDTPNGRTNAPNPRGVMTSRGSLHTSKGKLYEEYSLTIQGSSEQSKHPRKTKSNLYYRSRPSGVVPDDLTNPLRHHHSVAEIMGGPNRDKEKSGRGVKGTFNNDVMRNNHSVASAMNAAEHASSNMNPRRTLAPDHIPRSKHASVRDMKREMEDGTGVPMALGSYVRNNCSGIKSSELTRATSFNEYCLEGVDKTHVHDALHFGGH